MGEAEGRKLEQLRGRVPEIARRVREQSARAGELEHLTIWGVDMEGESPASDVILFKFLRAEDLDVEKAADRLAGTLQWRADERVDTLAERELPDHFQGHDDIGGVDPQGRPVLISRYGKMENEKVFSDTEAFVRYRLQVMEKAIAQLDFNSGAAETVCQVHDYSGVSSIFKSKEVKEGIRAMSQTFSQHYPETKGTTIFVSFPAIFATMFRAFSFFIPEATRKKFVVLGDSDQDLLFQHLAPEAVPESLGGLLRTPPSQLRAQCQLVRVGARSSAEVVACEVEGPADIFWELRVCNRDVEYKVVFAAVDGNEELVSRSLPGSLQAADGVVAGIFRPDRAGVLKVRFGNEGAWLSGRLCIVRAESSSTS